MADFSKESSISLTCPKRITPYLKQELKAQNYPIKKVRKAGLETRGSLHDCMKLVLTLRSAHRVHYLLDEFQAKDSDDMYEKVNRIPWEDYIESHGYVSVTSFIDNPTISNTQYANLTCKDAIVDRIRAETGSRPDSGPDLQHTVVFLYWRNNKCRVFLDASGESLSRRGYRTNSHSAPLQESLAAAIIMDTRWKPSMHFINPMCGSGTIAIEAALMALNRPAGSLRPNFGIKHIKGFDQDYWDQLRAELKLASNKDLKGKIIATDRDPRAIQAARKNAQTAGVDHLIQFEVCDFRDTPLPKGNGVVVLNPPYGERLGEKEQLQGLYKEIGDFFKQKCTDYTGYVFTGNLELAKQIGLRANRRTELYNSTIDCRLLEFELYDGSRE
jgi:putative N6-adenine-specific DNA methylase